MHGRRLGVVLFLLIQSSGTAIHAADQPNILLLVTDDQGWWDVGVHGNAVLETPVMDRLAADGVSFTHFYVQPVCAPTRAGLLTGRYYLRTGVYNTRFGGDTMRDDEITVAELLQQAGYRTGIFGKWHLGRYARYLPNRQGFDEFLGFLSGHAERYDYPDLLHNDEKVATRGYITDLLTDAAIDFISADRKRPFFCYVPYNVPHSPFIVGDAHAQQETGDTLIAKYLQRNVPLREARIYAMIERCDQNIGRLLNAVDRLGIREETIVWFMSDNGGIHRHFKAGLRGGKGSVWEGGVRSPLFVRWPERFPAGAKLDAVASHVDFLPTICDLLDLPLPSDRPIDGKSILALLRNGNGNSPHKYVYHTWERYTPSPDKRWSIGGIRYKLVGGTTTGGLSKSARQTGALYDLLLDPGETTDIAVKHPVIARTLRREFVRWFNDVTRDQVYEPVAIEIGRDDQNPVEIQTSWAKLDGDAVQYVFRAYDWDTVDSWNSVKETANWKVDVVHAGDYEVTVSYGAQLASSGSVFRISVGDQTLHGKVEPTPEREVFHQRKIGTVRLDAGRTTLTVAPVTVRGNELMALNRIWLRRIDR